MRSIGHNAHLADPTFKVYKTMQAYITLNELETTSKIPYQVRRLRGFIGFEIFIRLILCS